MALLTIDGRDAAGDWRHLGDDQPVVAGASVTVSFARWRAGRESLLTHQGGIGVRVTVTDDPVELSADLPWIDLIAVEFPLFRDGRGFSHARLLRSRLGYRGRLRAIGDVQRDQLDFMARCGFDEFELRADRDPADALRAFGEISIRYQSAADGPGLPRRGSPGRP